MAQNLTETHNSRDFRKILILSLSLSLESRSCWNANAGEILPAGSRPRLCKIRTLSSISRFENESPKKLPSLTSLGLDSRSRFIDLSVHSQPWTRGSYEWRCKVSPYQQCGCAQCIPFPCQQCGRAGCMPFHHQQHGYGKRIHFHRSVDLPSVCLNTASASSVCCRAGLCRGRYCFLYWVAWLLTSHPGSAAL